MMEYPKRGRVQSQVSSLNFGNKYGNNISQTVEINSQHRDEYSQSLAYLHAKVLRLHNMHKSVIEDTMPKINKISFVDYCKKKVSSSCPFREVYSRYNVTWKIGTKPYMFYKKIVKSQQVE